MIATETELAVRVRAYGRILRAVESGEWVLDPETSILLHEMELVIDRWRERAS
jgi:hypothetical protein